MTVAVDIDVKHQTYQTNKGNAESMLERLCLVDRKPALAFYKARVGVTKCESFLNSFFTEPKSNFLINNKFQEV